MRRELLIGFALAVLTLGIYWPARHFDFIQYDDPQFITENPMIKKGLTAEGVRYAFTEPVAGNWHPLTVLSHMLDCELFGANPGAQHLTNAVLHALNAAVLFLLVFSWTRALWRSVLVAVLFALHPLRVESVAWVSERKDLLSAWFFLLTLWTYSRWVLSRRAGAQERAVAKLPVWAWYVLVLVCFTLALMSKPMVVTVPFVLLLLDLWPLRRVGKPVTSLRLWLPLIFEKTPMFALSGAVCFVTYAIQNRVGAMSLMNSITFEERARNAVSSYLRYLGKWVLPEGLAAVYPHPARHYFLNDEWAAWQIGAGLAVLALITCFCLLRVSRQPWLSVGWLWFLGMLVPVIGLVQVGEQGMADRYTYLPLIGPTLAVVWTCGEMMRGARSRALEKLAVPAGALISLALAVCTVHQLFYWQNTVTLFEHTAAVTPDNPSAQFAIGVGLEQRGETRPAATQYRVALAIDPQYGKAHYNLGQLLRKEGRFAAAAEEYQAALRCHGEELAAHLNLAGVLLQLGRPAEAAEHFEQALRLDPNSTEALNNLAWLRATNPKPELRDGRRAVELAQRACALSGDKQPVFIGTLGAAYAEAGRFEEAEAAARKASETAASAGESQLAARNTELLELYRAKRAYHEPGP